MGCSILSEHLCNLHVKENPQCIACNKVENAEHFLTKCRLYQVPRISLMNEVTKLTPFCLNTLLYGSSNLTYEENAHIFNAVYKYFLDTKRFDM